MAKARSHGADHYDSMEDNNGGYREGKGASEPNDDSYEPWDEPRNEPLNEPTNEPLENPPRNQTWDNDVHQLPKSKGVSLAKANSITNKGKGKVGGKGKQKG